MLSVATLDVNDPGVGPKHIWVSHDAPWLTGSKMVAQRAEWHPEY